MPGVSGRAMGLQAAGDPRTPAAEVPVACPAMEAALKVESAKADFV